MAQYKGAASEAGRAMHLMKKREKQREQIYKDCMHTGNCREYIKMIKTLYHRKKVRVAAGKKITSTDERYLKQAEEALYSEFSVLFSIPREKMPEYISEKLSNAG